MYRFHPVGREQNGGEGGEVFVAPVQGEEVRGDDAGVRFALLCVAKKEKENGIRRFRKLKKVDSHQVDEELKAVQPIQVQTRVPPAMFKIRKKKMLKKIRRKKLTLPRKRDSIRCRRHFLSRTS